MSLVTTLIAYRSLVGQIIRQTIETRLVLVVPLPPHYNPQSVYLAREPHFREPDHRTFLPSSGQVHLPLPLNLVDVQSYGSSTITTELNEQLGRVCNVMLGVVVQRMHRRSTKLQPCLVLCPAERLLNSQHCSVLEYDSRLLVINTLLIQFSPREDRQFPRSKRWSSLSHWL